MTTVPALDDPITVRHVLVGYGRRLHVWNPGRRTGLGKAAVGYAFYLPGATEPLFAGENIGCSPLHRVGSDDCLRMVLGFLSLRPGDTDPDFFDGYTEDQLAWVVANGEELSLWAVDEGTEFEDATDW